MKQFRRGRQGVFVLVVSLMAVTGYAEELLPQGVGLYQLGYRHYAPQTHEYGADGRRRPLGEAFQQDFSGNNLLRGKAGPELQRLAAELHKFDGAGTELLQDLDLGRLEGEVRADVDVRVLGLGFGVTDRLTVFAGVPWVRADIRTELRLAGRNNATALKERLGEAAFRPLQDGLDQAAALNVDQITNRIAAAGYAPIDRWQNEGMGDVRVGAKTGAKWRRLALGLTTELQIPTGYVEDPDILTDVSFGKGYYSLGLAADAVATVVGPWQVGLHGLYAYNMSSEREVRLPEGQEATPGPERRTTVQWEPGDDTDVAGSFGFRYGLWSSQYRYGVAQHYGDRYGGDLAGNYAALERGTDKRQHYHEIRLGFSTVGPYRRGRFALPLLVSLRGRTLRAARNSVDEKYVELAAASFFSTPLARESAKPRRKGKKRRRARLRH